MNSRGWAIAFILLIAFSIISNPVLGQKENGKKRVITDSSSLLTKFFYRIQGCGVVHELADATALECPKAVVERYDLRDDRVFHVIGSTANTLIQADIVHNVYGEDGGGVVVAVLDTGVDQFHPELANDILPGGNFIGDGTGIYDGNGHGTHVAGIITSDGQADPESLGTAPGAKVWVAKVCDATGNCFESDIALAIEHVVNNGVARIISLSVGGGGTAGPNCNSDYLAKKVNWAYDNGVLVVVAAGNDGTRISSPACASNAIAVGSSNFNDYISVFSGRGKALDIVAPGENIYSTLPGGYGTMSGTSMATPIVSGTAALILSKNSSYTPGNIKTNLYSTAVDLGYSQREQGSGRINASAAYLYVPGDAGSGTGGHKCPKGKAKKGLC